MVWLILGVALWWAAHLFRHAAPGLRDRMGSSGRGAVALALIVSVLFMAIGYPVAESTYYWGRTPALVGINNLLVLFGFYLFAASGMKTWAATRIRHPQLIGFSLWAFAHLIVNGDTKSFILFGGLLLWALAEIVVLDRIRPQWTPPPAPVRKEIIAVVATIILYIVVAMLHGWAGYWPFG